MRPLILTLVALTVAACASTVQKSDYTAPAPATGPAAAAAPAVPAPTSSVPGAGKAVVLNITGSAVATTARDWSDFKELWPDPCTREARTAGAVLSMQQGLPTPTGAEGTLVVVEVSDYRYVSTGARIAFGVMTGNAYIKAHVTFRDLKSGEVLSSKAYDTTSSAWSGVFSGMTVKQVSAMCHEIFVDMHR
jgi:hypothetical protein